MPFVTLCRLPEARRQTTHPPPLPLPLYSITSKSGWPPSREFVLRTVYSLLPMHSLVCCLCHRPWGLPVSTHHSLRMDDFSIILYRVPVYDIYDTRYTLTFFLLLLLYNIIPVIFYIGPRGLSWRQQGGNRRQAATTLGRTRLQSGGALGFWRTSLGGAKGAA